MSKWQGTGGLMLWIDVDPALRRETDAWYVDEHLPERVDIAGYRNARRYLAVEGAPRIYRSSKPTHPKRSRARVTSDSCAKSANNRSASAPVSAMSCAIRFAFARVSAVHAAAWSAACGCAHRRDGRTQAEAAIDQLVPQIAPRMAWSARIGLKQRPNCVPSGCRGAVGQQDSTDRVDHRDHTPRRDGRAARANAVGGRAFEARLVRGSVWRLSIDGGIFVTKDGVMINYYRLRLSDAGCCAAVRCR